MNLRYLPIVTFALAGCQQATTPPAVARAQPKPTPKTKPAALDVFLEKPEPVNKWSDASAQFRGDGFANLRLISQTWQGRDWSHRLQIFKPTRVDFPDAAVINISYGSGSFGETILGQGLADISGAVTINLFNVPNQPLYDRQEDPLVAYSFQKFLETGDSSWPILLPMTKSVVKAMDAVSEWSKKTTGKPITRFIVAGASKRGWTAYLAAAGDKRVVGCVPIVYDNLNIAAQIKHQKEVWGQTSQSAVAFSDLGLFDEGATGSARGKELLQAVDPYFYLKRLTMPIFSINATNDGYWPHDAQTIYRDELTKQTSLSTYYAPNSTHFLGPQIIPLAQSSAVWSRLVLSKAKIPMIDLKRNGNVFRGAISDGATNVMLWLAQTDTKDFRRAKWVQVPMKKTANGWEATVDNAKLRPFGCAFAQAQWSEKGTDSPLVLASPMWTNSAGVLMARAF